MRKQAFGDTLFSVIGLGSAHFGGKTAESQAREFMDAYAAMGGNLIDTARVYGDFVTPGTEKAKRSSAGGSQTAAAGETSSSAPKAAIRRFTIPASVE